VTEEPLRGGNMTGGVVRVGDTVRRPAAPWTPAVHALLDHLQAVGFRGAPRAHGGTTRAARCSTSCPAPCPTTSVSGCSTRTRVRVLADAYGASPEERRDLLDRLEPRTRVMHDFLRDQAALRNLPWLRHWQEGHGDVWRRDADYIAAHENIWRAALRA